MKAQASNRVRIFSWACFDFANSVFGAVVLSFVYSSYFVNGIASDENTGATQWGNTVAIASILIALISPALGAAADAFGWKKRFMMVSICLACLATAALYFPQPGDVLWALFLFGAALFATEMSIVFNNAFLPEIAPREKHGKVSGLAFAFGYAGGLICLFIALIGLGLLNEDAQPWFGFSHEGDQNIRASNLLVAVWFAIFSLPLLLAVKERKPPQHSEGLLSVATRSFRRLNDTFHHLRDYRRLFWLLIARLFYNDGLVAIFSFGGVYATVVFGFTFKDLMLFGIALNVLAMLGALGFAYIEDNIGSRTTIIISLLALVGASTAALFVESKNAFWACALVIGLFIGPNQSASRAYLSRMTPLEKANEFFGFYAFSGKATAFFGPLLYGWLTGWFDSHRVGMTVVPALLVIGLLLLLLKVEPKEDTRIIP